MFFHRFIYLFFSDTPECSAIDLRHGRLAMLASLELFRHDMSGGADGLDNLITGLPFIYN